MPSVYYNRIPKIPLREEIRALDPNHRAPLTPAEYASLPATDRSKIDALLARVRVPLALQNKKVDRSGRSVLNTYIRGLGAGDDRSHTKISTTVSEHNLVEPLFSSVVVPEGKTNFDERLIQLIDQAKKFIFVEGFQLGREDHVERLIERARAGVQVVALFDPANEDSEGEKKRLLAKMRAAAKNDPDIRRHDSLHVAEYKVIPHGGGYGFEQILHVKKVIADRPGGSIAEISGGINFGANSHNNFDTAWYTEGVAALDSLNRTVRHYPAAADGSRPFDLSTIPTAAKVRAAVRRKMSSARALTTVEIAGAGQARVEKPRKYSIEQLQEAARVGRKIVISARDVIKPGVADVLVLALQNGSWVKVVEPKLSAAQEAKLKPLAKKLRNAGAGIYKADAVLHEGSYAALVYRELDAAIDAGESVDIAAFCLTDDGVIQRLIRAKQAGCKVRVLVDDLNLYGMLINRKAIALLTAAHVEVKIFDDTMAKALAPEGARDTKLHSKLIVIGGKRVLGGSANFTRNGFANNIEDGRLIRSRSIAKAFSKKLFNPLWDACPKVHEMRTVRERDRLSLIDRVPMETPIRDLVFVVCDTETTGFKPEHDERVLQVSLKAVRIKSNGEMEVLEELDEYVDPGDDATGKPFAISSMARRVHGLDAATLEEFGARDIREVLPEVVDFIKRQKAHGKVVMAGQNVAFDMRFLDFALSRRSIANLDGIDKLSLDGPFVDVSDVSAKLFPKEAGNDLDSLLARLRLRRRRADYHNAVDDVDLTSKVLARLLKKGGRKLRTLGDLMGPDLLSIGAKAVFVSETNDGPRAHKLEEPVSGYLFVRSKEGGRYGEPQRVRDLSVVDVDLDADRLLVEIVAGSSSNPTTLRGYVAPGDVRFHAPGSAYHRLRAAGHSMPKPYVLKRR